MSRKLISIAALALCPWAAPAMAAERIYCAASDSVVDMSLESGFSKKEEHKLVHFRGMAGVKDKDVPADFRKFQIASDMLRQYWMDGTDMRFSIQAFSPKKTPIYRVTMSMVTSRSTETEPRFKGRYDLKVQRLNNGSTVGATTMLTHEAPLFCVIKG